jgi:hypothetical protein
VQFEDPVQSYNLQKYLYSFKLETLLLEWKRQK